MKPYPVLQPKRRSRKNFRTAFGRAVRRARRMARTVATRVAAANRAQRARRRSRVWASNPARYPQGGGSAIELWRADDDGISARDSELQARVFEELGADPGLDPSRLKVVVKRGAVTLSGTVGNESEKVAAERAARRLRGVQVVSNHISVGTTLMSRWSGASA